MTGLEWENFVKLDNEEYILEKNEEFIKYYKKKKKEGYRSILDLKQMQVLINEITQFFEFKYPDKLLNEIIYEKPVENKMFEECMKMTRSLDINQLKYRLDYNQLAFLECDYSHHIRLIKEPDIWFCSTIYDVRFDQSGKIEKRDIEGLKTEKFLDDVEGIERVEDLLGRYIGIEIKVDYSELVEEVQRHKNNVTLRNKILDLVMLNLLYSKNTYPRNGYVRAKRFMRMFNKEYGIDLNMNKLDKIMSIDYSNNKEVKKLLKERRK